LPALHLQPSFKGAPSGVKRDNLPKLESFPRAEAPPKDTLADQPAPAADVIVTSPPSPVVRESGVDFAAMAHLCTRLARAIEVCEITPVLERAVSVLRAVGLTLWVRDRMGHELIPVYAHGYSNELTAQLGPVSRDSDNAIGWAFRTAEARVVDQGEMATGAVVVPLLTPTGCAGVLAIELRNGGERLECVRAAAAILAAQLSTLVGAPVLAEAVSA
jgi:hypothetical protein